MVRKLTPVDVLEQLDEDDIRVGDYVVQRRCPHRNADLAAALLADALADRLRILVVGDFDADGATSTTLACPIARNKKETNVKIIYLN